jgi:hypothetical protein
VNDPELRCLVCDAVLADDSVPSESSGKCGQCGKRILPANGFAEPEPLTLVRTTEQPAATPTNPPPIPEAFPRAKIVPTIKPTLPTVRNLELPDSEPPKPKLAFALFVAFLTLLAIMASLTVIGYAIVVGLKKAAKRADPVPTTRTTVPPSSRK